MLDAPNALGHCSGAISERPRDGSASLLTVSCSLPARPGRPKIGLGAACGRLRAVPSVSGRVPSASRRVPGTALGTQNGPGSIFRRFLVDFPTIVDDLRPILHQIFDSRADIFARCRGVLRNHCRDACACSCRSGGCSSAVTLRSSSPKNSQ